MTLKSLVSRSSFRTRSHLRRQRSQELARPINEYSSLAPATLFCQTDSLEEKSHPLNPGDWSRHQVVEPFHVDAARAISSILNRALASESSLAFPEIEHFPQSLAKVRIVLHRSGIALIEVQHLELRSSVALLLTQIVSEALGVFVPNIRVVTKDTGRQQPCRSTLDEVGEYARRATLLACEDITSRLLSLAGRRINANPNEPLEVLSQSNIDVVEGVGVWLAGPEVDSNMEPFL